PDVDVIFADRHDVTLVPNGTFAEILGCETIRVNSLHGQGILEPGKRVVIEGVAEDGTIEAIRIADAASFALGVQWHAEYDPQRNPINRTPFQAFCDALKTHMRGAEVRAASRDLSASQRGGATRPDDRLREEIHPSAGEVTMDCF